MSPKIGVSILLIVVAYLTTEVAAKIEFTNLVCTSLDKAFSDFEYCYLRSVNRTYKYFSIKSVFYQSPITRAKVAAKVEFTNFVCTSFDQAFADFEYCYLKSVNRTYKYFSVKCNLYQTPVRKANRFSGYRPFMYNITADACRFLKNPQSNPVLNFFYATIVPYTNINHSCPYEHDIFMEKVPTQSINGQFGKLLPFPDGDYLIELNWIANDIKRAVTKLYFTLS
ncbi:uncharacterized protein LOC117892705 [Drosophila subobscura]|uniref:uncharacterized protein LOC117892705 n=1 Tax=Drosophila subobscura TaxID=7241 RepID=UPI00155AD69A|nr:uncharacterized protein LOC117892705 [Drosophila subobscura]